MASKGMMYTLLRKCGPWEALGLKSWRALFKCLVETATLCYRVLNLCLSTFSPGASSGPDIQKVLNKCFLIQETNEQEADE